MYITRSVKTTLIRTSLLVFHLSRNGDYSNVLYLRFGTSWLNTKGSVEGENPSFRITVRSLLHWSNEEQFIPCLYSVRYQIVTLHLFFSETHSFLFRTLSTLGRPCRSQRITEGLGPSVVSGVSDIYGSLVNGQCLTLVSFQRRLATRLGEVKYPLLWL